MPGALPIAWIIGLAERQIRHLARLAKMNRCERLGQQRAEIDVHDAGWRSRGRPDAISRA
jgi:hypothetical protein